MDHISSIAAFFKSGQLSDLLKQPDQVEEEKLPQKKENGNRGNGRPLLTYANDKGTYIDITTSNVYVNSDEGREKESAEFLEISTAIKTMLQLPQNYTKNDKVYVLWEIWMDRGDGISINDDYSPEEEMSIIFGPRRNETVNVIRYFVQINPDGFVENYHFKTQKGHLPRKNETMVYYNLISDVKFKSLKVGSIVDCTTIGTSCGKLFSFPKWMKDENVDNFVLKYNEAALKIIKPGNKISQFKMTKEARKAQYKILKEAWIQDWLTCVKKKKTLEEPLTQWNNTFDLALIYDHNFTSMSMFTLFGTKKGQLETQNDFNEDKPVDDKQNGENDADSAVQNEHYLLPYSSNSRYKQVFSKTKLFSIMFNPDGALKQKEELIPIEKTSKDIKLDENTVNLFALLKQSNGVQSIELANLASVLGSEVHVSVADYLFEKTEDEKKKEMKNLSAITDPKTLHEYAKHLPSIVQKIATNFVTFLEYDNTRASEPKDHHNLQMYIKTVEFPVYLFFGDSLPPFYSRIDAISHDYELGDGYAVWEYKTRWGKDTIDKPDIDAIRQAAFYCYCLFEMTGITCKFFYIRYAKTIQEKIIFKTFKYKYVLGQKRYLFDFKRRIKKLKKDKKLK